MTGDHSDVLIVGASLAGLTTAEALRDDGYSGAITLIGDERHAPYSRPPLSKQVLAGEWIPAQTTLRDQAELDVLSVTFIEGRAATALDTHNHLVTAGDLTLGFERLVVATGVTPRQLAAGKLGIHSLRTLEDLAALTADLEGAASVAVVGAGLLGCEIASALRASGLEVTLVSRAPELRFGSVGRVLSALVTDLLTINDIVLRFGVDVVDVLGESRATGVLLSDGSTVEADVVVAAIGCEPAVTWLRGSGLDLSNGVVCDSDGRAAPDVYAVGDVACWRDRVTGAGVRVEHQTNAIEQAQAVGRLIATGETSPPIIPFYWSQLFGTKILVHGTHPRDASLTTIAGDVADGRFVAASIRDGAVLGLIGWNMPREFRRARGAVSLDELVDSLEERAQS